MSCGGGEVILVERLVVFWQLVSPSRSQSYFIPLCISQFQCRVRSYFIRTSCSF